jgi:hypothetical protein
MPAHMLRRPAAAAAALACLVLIAACGSSSGPTSDPSPSASAPAAWTPSATPVSSGPGGYRGGLWTGITTGHIPSRFTFTVRGGQVSDFVDPAIGCFTWPAGYQVQTIALPGATPIGSGGAFDEVVRPTEATQELKGTFTAADAAAGTISQAGVCDTGTVPWVARPGSTPPPPPPPPRVDCPTDTNCQATDGLLVDVVGVDRTLTSIQNPQDPPYIQTIDRTLAATGGILLEVVLTNPTAAPITITTSGGMWTLGDGAGGHEPSLNEQDNDVVTTDGAIATNGSTCENAVVTIAPGRTAAPFALCFAVSAAARSGAHLLFNYPDTMASLPLG